MRDIHIFTNHDIIKARVCSVINIYGGGFLTSPDSVATVCKGLEACMCSTKRPVQINAIIALNKICSNELVLKQFAPGLPNLLELIVQCMNAMDYKELVYAAEGIIKDFGDQVLPFAVQLFKHFHSSFYQYMQHSKINNDEDEEDEDEDDEEIEANVAYESVYAAEACLEAILSLLQLNLPQTLRTEAHSMVLFILCDILLEENNELFIKALGLLNYVLFKEETLNEATKFFFPILCYILHKKPTLQLQLSAAAASLPEQFQRVLVEVDLPDLSDSVVTHSLGCMLNFIAKLGVQFHSSTDYYGVLYVELLFDMIVHTVKDALTGPTDLHIVFMLRIVVGLLESSKDKFTFPMRESFFVMVLNLTEWNRTESLTNQLLQTISMFVWHSPKETIDKLRQMERLESFYSCLYGKLESFTEEKAKERILYGLIALLELSPDDVKVSVGLIQGMNLGLIFGAIVKLGEELSKLRIDASLGHKEAPKEEIDLTDDKEYEDDDEDEDFDDADEELEAIENDDKFRYTSPLDNLCPLVYLKFILTRLEKESPENFKTLMGVLSQEQINILLMSVKCSEEYLLKLAEESKVGEEKPTWNA